MRTATLFILALCTAAAPALAGTSDDANRKACKTYLETGAQPPGEKPCDLSRDKPHGSLILGGASPTYVYREQADHQVRFVGEASAKTETPKTPDQ